MWTVGEMVDAVADAFVRDGVQISRKYDRIRVGEAWFVFNRYGRRLYINGHRVLRPGTKPSVRRSINIVLSTLEETTERQKRINAEYAEREFNQAVRNVAVKYGFLTLSNVLVAGAAVLMSDVQGEPAELARIALQNRSDSTVLYALADALEEAGRTELSEDVRRCIRG